MAQYSSALLPLLLLLLAPLPRAVVVGGCEQRSCSFGDAEKGRVVLHGRPVAEQPKEVPLRCGAGEEPQHEIFAAARAPREELRVPHPAWPIICFACASTCCAIPPFVTHIDDGAIASLRAYCKATPILPQP